MQLFCFYPEALIKLRPDDFLGLLSTFCVKKLSVMPEPTPRKLELLTVTNKL